MEATKPIDANQGNLRDEKVETPTRLEALVSKYPDKFEDFRVYFRQNGISDQVFYNLRKGRQGYKLVHKMLIDRMVRHFDLNEK